MLNVPAIKPRHEFLFFHLTNDMKPQALKVKRHRCTRERQHTSIFLFYF